MTSVALLWLEVYYLNLVSSYLTSLLKWIEESLVRHLLTREKLFKYDAHYYQLQHN